MSRVGIGARLLGSLMVSAACVWAAGCDKPPAPSGGAASAPARTAESPKPKTLRAGEKAVAGTFEITLLRAVRAAESSKTPPAGERYVVLRFRVKNAGTAEADGDVSRDLQWKNAADGMRNGPESMTGVKLQNPDNRRLAPGAEAEFEAAYRTPNGLAELEFHYVPGYDPLEKARWTIAIE